jgi:hypothetical protein
VQFRDNPVFAMLFLEAVAICLLISFRFINLESTVNLLCFNLLFVSMTFILNAPLNRKLVAALGNVHMFSATSIINFSTVQAV